MDSRDMVLRKEGDGIGYYERCSADAGDGGFSTIFRMFSEDELRHAGALRALRAGGRVDLPRSPTLQGARSILRRLSIEELSSCRGDLGVYRNAMQFEALSARACSELAREALHPWEREMFQTMADEDEMHFTLLEEMQELLEETDVQ
ncbi:ferritin family protein [Geomonas subterranea]|uniref:Ferritin n=1 Tax=Geomonas subterranea TaxID=2847989 RepID=A0ABX8LHK1_9BACT|nr:MULTISPECIES: ferritin family protein [Geomonas]QXE91447.1 ferritin [Geomonas subterranea]QXM10465.1 ferritin [Geomonas subterranea]